MIIMGPPTLTTSATALSTLIIRRAGRQLVPPAWRPARRRSSARAAAALLSRPTPGWAMELDHVRVWGSLDAGFGNGGCSLDLTDAPPGCEDPGFLVIPKLSVRMSARHISTIPNTPILVEVAVRQLARGMYH